MSVIIVSVTFTGCYAKRRYAECHYIECRGACLTTKLYYTPKKHEQKFAWTPGTYDEVKNSSKSAL
jgi:hypothetical protein